MKKEKKPGQKQKDFASRPFGSLKSVRTGLKAEPPAPLAPAPLQKPEISPDDAELFLRAVADAKRLHPSQAPHKGEKKPAPPQPSRHDEEERALFHRALEALQLDVAFRDQLPDEEPPVPPLVGNRLRRLKRGALRIDLELDLHGLTREEALKALAAFIASAHNRGQRGVLVITGKGNRSSGEPVLQSAVTGWLREKGKGLVAEFAPAPREMGGSGAFVVFLKEKEKVEVHTP